MEQSINPDLTLFRQLESVTTDPIVEHALGMAREYEKMVNAAGNTTAEERNALIAELDANWPYIEAPIIVSGYASFADPTTNEVSKQYYDEAQMTSNGFCFTPDHLMHDDEIVVEQYKVKLHLIKMNDDDASQGRVGTGDIDEVTIEYPSHSIAMVENRLQYFHSETLEELDCIILNCNTEEEAIVALGKFGLSVKISDDEDMQFVADIQAYLRKSLEFDHALPYKVAITGECFVNQEMAVTPVVVEGELVGLAQIKGIQFLPLDLTAPKDVKQRVVPCVDLYFYSPNKEAVPTNLLVPAASMNRVLSTRREVYEA
ncbi:MAG: hypothetical protein ABWX90_03075 [Candidatus Saccharimonadales bacterium]